MEIENKFIVSAFCYKAEMTHYKQDSLHQSSSTTNNCILHGWIQVNHHCFLFYSRLIRISFNDNQSIYKTIICIQLIVSNTWNQMDYYRLLKQTKSCVCIWYFFNSYFVHKTMVIYVIYNRSVIMAKNL